MKDEHEGSCADQGAWETINSDDDAAVPSHGQAAFPPTMQPFTIARDTVCFIIIKLFLGALNITGA